MSQLKKNIERKERWRIGETNLGPSGTKNYISMISLDYKAQEPCPTPSTCLECCLPRLDAGAPSDEGDLVPD